MGFNSNKNYKESDAKDLLNYRHLAMANVAMGC